MSNYEVSCDMTFANESDATALCTAVNAIDSAIGATAAGVAGSYEVTFQAMEAAQSTQQSIVSALQSSQSASSIGQIEYHLCNNDTDQPCQNACLQSWGGYQGVGGS
jgi:hypothetical protein